MILQEATELGDSREATVFSEFGRYGEIADMQSAHERYAYALLRCGEPGEALTQLELGKTRAQREWLGVSDGRPRTESADPRRLVPAGGALVLPLVTPRGSAIWILTDDSAEPPYGEVLELPAVTEEDLLLLLKGQNEQLGWNETYRMFLSAMSQGPGARQARRAIRNNANSVPSYAVRKWADVIDDTARDLYSLLMEPIAAKLRQKGVARGANVVIIPSKWLSNLPLHAAWQRSSQGSRRYFSAEFAVSFAPSLFVLDKAIERAAARAAKQRSLLAVSDATLEETADEVNEVASHFDENSRLVLSGDNATAETFMSEARRFSHIHLACHGEFNFLDPWRSSLYLSEAERLDIGTLARASVFQNAQLVTLPSCESGVTETDDVPLEFVGLGGAFLQAGAPCVLSCLWSIDDRATRMFMKAFYDEYLENGVSPVKALQSAQRRLRQTPQYAHPYFWAAFVLVGAAL